MIQVFLGIGSNLGDPKQQVLRALRHIQALQGVHDFAHSRLYISSPVSDIPQGHYVNAVCTFNTLASPEDLFQSLEAIEFALGKIPKAKNEPRFIDIDVLFYGTTTSDDPRLTLPHPRWKERLFVLLPLYELTQENFIKDLIDHFFNREGDFVFPLFFEDYDE